ncbi:MAG: hypothetical protein AAF206_12365 [Bacteroidota bacterium]
MKRIGHSFLSVITALIICLVLPSCNREEALPVYLDMNNTQIRLSNSGKITNLGLRDIWVDHNSERLGVFRHPAIVPMIPQETNVLTFSGGVFETGLSSSRIRYPFWQSTVMEVDAAPLDTVPIRMTIEYFSDSVLAYPLVEEFEGSSLAFTVLNEGEPASLDQPTAGAFDGTRSGRVRFSDSERNFEMVSTDFLALPQNGNNDIYVEVTYRNNIPFTAGLFFANSAEVGELPSNVFFDSNLEWNTAYIHVNDQVRGTTQGSLFKLYLRANGGGADGVIFFDNIRIVHFRE